MLKEATALLLGVSMVLGDDHINRNNVTARYIIHEFNENNFPLSVDTCNPTTIFGNRFQKATCLDEDNIKLEYFQNNLCSGEPDSNLTYSYDANLTGSGLIGDFNCDEDAVNAYAAIVFGFSCNTNQIVTIRTALSVCALGDDTSINIYCEDNWAEMQYYNSSAFDESDCSEQYLDQIVNATEECGFIVRTQEQNVFGWITNCTLDANHNPATTGPSSTDGGSDTDSASQLLATMGLFVAAIFGGLKL